MNLTIDEVAELDWYFSGAAEADCGVRSVQGGFESAMDKLAKTGRPRGWEWLPAGEADHPARETRSTCSASWDAMERLDRRRQKLADYCRIYQRLHRMDDPTRQHLAVLDLHFGDAVRIHGVSLSLLCMTKPVRVACAKVNEKRRRRAEKQDREPPDDLGPRDAVQRMHTSDSSAEQAILEELVTEAAGWLRAALEAYSKARV